MRSLIIIMALALGGCVELGADQTVNINDHTEIKVMTNKTYDRHMDQVTLISPWIKSYQEDARIRLNYTVRTLYKGRVPIEKQHPLSQIYFAAGLNDWAFFDTAYSNGKAYKLVRIDSEVKSCYRFNSCDLTEDFALNLSRSDLETYSKYGLSLKLQGQRKSAIVDIPASYFKGHVEAIKYYTK